MNFSFYKFLFLFLLFVTHSFGINLDSCEKCFESLGTAYCLPNSETKEFECMCHHNWFGDFCEFEAECNCEDYHKSCSNPFDFPSICDTCAPPFKIYRGLCSWVVSGKRCINGEWELGSDFYFCKCNQYFYGNSCEFPIKSKECKYNCLEQFGNGVCNESIGECECFHPWEGRYCNFLSTSSADSSYRTESFSNLDCFWFISPEHGFYTSRMCVCKGLYTKLTSTNETLVLPGFPDHPGRCKAFSKPEFCFPRIFRFPEICPTRIQFPPPSYTALSVSSITFFVLFISVFSIFLMVLLKLKPKKREIVFIELRKTSASTTSTFASSKSSVSLPPLP